jgi:DNA (cytosine-5)-methyltransferase 1
MPNLTVGSLFAGIGGLDLGAERAGFDVIWQCEQDDYCTKVLNKHWPDVPVYNDVQTLYTDDGPEPEKPNILCGGFPCQDISLAGHGEGINGDRSGLWWEFCRLIRTVRPEYAVVENVPAITHRGLKAILGSLAEIGYDAEWQTISAEAFGAPHQRERFFLVSYPSGICDNQMDEAKALQVESRGMGTRSSPWAGWEANQSEMGREGDGLPNNVDRLKGLGNAVVPQVAEFVFNCVKNHHE